MFRQPANTRRSIFRLPHATPENLKKQKRQTKLVFWAVENIYPDATSAATKSCTAEMVDGTPAKDFTSARSLLASLQHSRFLKITDRRTPATLSVTVDCTLIQAAGTTSTSNGSRVQTISGKPLSNKCLAMGSFRKVPAPRAPAKVCSFDGAA
jgi:hypothetical protein